MAVPTYRYQTPQDLQDLEREYMAAVVADDPIFQVLPIRTKKVDRLRWTQRDSYYGMMQARGLNNEYPVVKRAGSKTFEAMLGYYGEQVPLYEDELTRRANAAGNGPVDVSDLVEEATQQLTTRQIVRLSTIGWKLFTTGVYEAFLPDGVLMTQEVVSIRKATGSNWGTAATSTPMADMRSVNALPLGTVAKFGSSAKAYLNTVTANKMFANTNAADLGGQKRDGGGNLRGRPDFDLAFLAYDLPTLVIYDGGYLDDSGTFVKRIADDHVHIVGTYAGQTILGATTIGYHADLGDAGVFIRTQDTTKDPIAEPPGKVKVFRGMNAGAEIWYPGSFVDLYVGA